jgi:hypothetical protein
MYLWRKTYHRQRGKDSNPVSSNTKNVVHEEYRYGVFVRRNKFLSLSGFEPRILQPVDHSIYKNALYRLLNAGSWAWDTKIRYLILFFQAYQQDVTLYNILYYCQFCACFKRCLRSSSDAVMLLMMGRETAWNMQSNHSNKDYCTV